jgi:signal transduction histidine kinase
VVVKPFFGERLDMDTDQLSDDRAFLVALDSPDWSAVLDAMSAAHVWIRTAIIGDPRLDEVVARLVTLAHHQKWEIRRAVANAAGQAAHPAFEPALAKLLLDDNGRVRQAAQQAALRRRDSRNASSLGKQHAERINATLDDIEARFGSRGRDAVKRAADQIANTFARELYHEIIRLLSPLAMSAERLRTQLSANEVSHSVLREEADRVGQRVTHLRAVLNSMRAYTEQPTLQFTTEVLQELLEGAAALTRTTGRDGGGPSINIQVPPDMIVEVSRARLVQALTNVLENAVESYDGLESRKPIEVRADAHEGLVTVIIEDSGCGMSAEALADAVTLFATSKPNGTGFGLPLAVKILESEHGGRVELQSRKESGTTVRLTFRTQR